MYKGASQALQHRTAVDRPHPSKGYIDGPSDARDVLPETASMTLDDAQDEKRRLQLEVNRLEQELAVAKASQRGIAVICSQKVTVQDRLKLVNQRIKEINMRVSGDVLSQAIKDVVGFEIAGQIFSRAAELRRAQNEPPTKESE